MEKGLFCPLAFVLVAGIDSDPLDRDKQASGPSLAVPEHSTCVAGEKVYTYCCRVVFFLRVSKQSQRVEQMM